MAIAATVGLLATNATGETISTPLQLAEEAKTAADATVAAAEATLSAAKTTQQRADAVVSSLESEPPPPPEEGSVVWNGDFDTANASQYTELLGNPARLSFPTSPSDQGTHSARLQLNPGEKWTDGSNRMQLRKAPWKEGQDLYFHWAIYIDPLMVIGGSFSNPWRAIVAWPTSQDGNCSPLKFFLMRSKGADADPNGVDSFTVGGDLGHCSQNVGNQWIFPNPVKGAWYEFITHIKFSATSGIFEFWMKQPGGEYVKQMFNYGALTGKQVYTGATIGHAGMDANLRLGIYRNPAFTTTDFLYYDGVRAASTFAAAQ